MELRGARVEVVASTPEGGDYVCVRFEDQRTEWVCVCDLTPATTATVNAQRLPLPPFTHQRLALACLEDLCVSGEWRTAARMWCREFSVGTGASAVKLQLWEDVPDDGADGELTIWPAGLVLARFIECTLAGRLGGKVVIELGAGAACPALTAAAVGASRVVATEQLLALPHLRSTVESNAGAVSVEVAELEWGPDVASRLVELGVPPADLVLVADCTYDKDNHALLLNTLLGVSAPSATVLLTHDTSSVPSLKNHWAEFATSSNCQQHFTFELLAEDDVSEAVGERWFSPTVQVWRGVRFREAHRIDPDP